MRKRCGGIGRIYETWGIESSKVREWILPEDPVYKFTEQAIRFGGILHGVENTLEMPRVFCILTLIDGQSFNQGVTVYFGMKLKRPERFVRYPESVAADVGICQGFKTNRGA
jgi:hypothetical protein